MKNTNKLMVLALIMLLAVPFLSVFTQPAKAADKFFTAEISPTTMYAGLPATYTITLTNIGTSGIGTVNVTIPNGFTSVSTPPILTPSTWITWFQAQDKISLKPNHPSEVLGSGQSLQVTFEATAPSTPGNYVWIVYATTNTGLGGQEFTISGIQPFLTVTPIINLDPQTGPVGTPVVVTGSNFAPTSTITFTYNGSPLGLTTTSTSSGMIPSGVTFSVPASTAGNHLVTATDSSSNSVSTNFTVTPQIKLDLNAGPVDTPVTVSGTGFAANSHITATFDGSTVTLMGITNTNSKGSFSGATLTIPPSSLGQKIIAVNDASSNTASVQFTIGLATPTISVSLSSSSIEAGNSVIASAFLSQATGSASGIVTYALYTGPYPSGTLHDSDTETVSSHIVPSSKTFTIYIAGSYYFIATYSGDSNNNPANSDSATLIVNYATASNIDVEPKIASIEAGDSFSFTATASDGYNTWDVTSLVTWAISSGAGGSVSASGMATANNVGDWEIMANLGSLSDSATLIVTHATSVESVSVSPPSANLKAGDSQTYVAYAVDPFGNKWDVSSSVVWGIDLGASGLWNGATYTSANAGDWMVTAALSGVSSPGSSSLTVTANPDQLNYVVISPKTSTIAAGNSQSYTALAYDLYGNSWSIVANYSCPDSKVLISGSSASSTTAGSYTVTGTYDGKSDNATLTVTANSALLNYIVISPKTPTILAGVSQAFSVEAYDQYGNDLGDVTTSSTINVNGVQTISNIVSEDLVGSYSVTATYSDLSDYTTLAVTGHTVIFTNSVLPTGITWSVTFNNIFYSSTTNTIAITDLSAITYSWNTATYIQSDGTRYVVAQTSGSISVPTQLSQNIEYSTQYLVTYATTGNVLPTNSPANEWINSGNTATGIFPSQVVNSQSNTRCNFISDNRPSTITGPTTITATYQTQYLVKYATTGNALPITAPADEWANSGLASTGTFTQQIVNSAETARCNLIRDNRTLITQPTTILATYQTQYYLTVTSPHSTINGAGWYDSGSTALAALSSGTISGSGTQFIFTTWSGDTSGTALTSNTIAMDSAKNAVANWKTQYYLTVTSTYGSPSGQGWYDAGSAANIALTQTISSGAISQNVFSSWSGSGSGAYTGSSATSSITMNGPITETAIWRIQYLVTYKVTGNAISVTVPSDEWTTAGTAAKGTFSSTITNQGNDTKCIYINDNRTSTITQPTTITAKYQTQYKVTFNQTGIESDVIGIIVTIFGDAKNYTQLATTTWINNLAKVNFTFANDISSTIANKQYALAGINATSPITIDQPTFVQANYLPQYSSSLFTVAEFALIIFALLLLLVLLLAWRRRRKKKQEENKSKTTSSTPT